jgi:colicin import membrane protein
LPFLDSKRALSEQRIKKDFVRQGISITLEKSKEQIEFEKAEVQRRELQAQQKAEQLEKKRQRELEEQATKQASEIMAKLRAKKLIESSQHVQKQFIKLRRRLKLKQFQELKEAAVQIRPVMIESIKEKEEIKRLELLKQQQRKKQQEEAELAMKQHKLKLQRLEKQKTIFGHALRQINRKQII